jgi:hypothetical protein
MKRPTWRAKLYFFIYDLPFYALLAFIIGLCILAGRMFGGPP